MLPPLSCLLVEFVRRELLSDILPLLVQRPDLSFCRGRLGSRKRVKNRDLPVRIEQRLVLMLAVDVEQQGRKSFYLRDIACLAIDAADAADPVIFLEIIT